MKQLFYLFFFVAIPFLYGQDKGTVPKYGKMIFSVEKNVFSNQKLDSSIQLKKPVVVNMFKDMFKEITLAQGVAHDTVALNKHIEN